MKFIFSTLVLFFSAQSFASTVKCDKKAETAVKRSSKYASRYAGEEVRALTCELAPNGGAVICEVEAFKGNGEASDQWRVVLNKTCSKVFRIELLGDE